MTAPLTAAEKLWLREHLAQSLGITVEPGEEDAWAAVLASFRRSQGYRDRLEADHRAFCDSMNAVLRRLESDP